MKWSSSRQIVVRNPRVAVLVAVVLLLASACAGGGSRRVPAIEGRVVDASTGKPIQGAVFVRYLSKEVGLLSPGGSDVKIIGDSFERATSDAQGVFRLPSQWRWGPVYWDWAFYCPGRAAAIMEAFNRDSTSWLAVQRRDGTDRAEMTFRVSSPSVPEEWVEYFRQLGVMTRSYWHERIIPTDDVVKEAVGYVERGGELTPGVQQQLGPTLQSVDLETARRLEIACALRRSVPCPDEFRSRILRRRLLLEVN